MSDNQKTKSKTWIWVVLILVVVILAFVVGFVVANMGDEPEDAIETDYSSNFIPEKTILTGDIIAECIQDASELVCMKYSYTDYEEIENHKELFDLKVPFTTEKVVVLYDGIIKSGIDISELKYYIDNENDKVTILLPEPKIISHELDTENFEFFDVKKSAFTEISPEEFTDNLQLMKEKAEDKFAENEEYLDGITNNAKNIIENLLTLSGVIEDYELDIVTELPKGFDIPESVVGEEEETETESKTEEVTTGEETEEVTTEE